MNTGDENETTGVAVGASNAAGDENWRWMVAADPAFYLDEPGGAGRPGAAEEGR